MIEWVPNEWNGTMVSIFSKNSHIINFKFFFTYYLLRILLTLLNSQPVFGLVLFHFVLFFFAHTAYCRCLFLILLPTPYYFCFVHSLNPQSFEVWATILYYSKLFLITVFCRSYRSLLPPMPLITLSSCLLHYFSSHHSWQFSLDTFLSTPWLLPYVSFVLPWL